MFWLSLNAKWSWCYQFVYIIYAFQGLDMINIKVLYVQCFNWPLFSLQVSWDKTFNCGSTYQEDDQIITHQIVDRPNVTRKHLSRWGITLLWRCINKMFVIVGYNSFLIIQFVSFILLNIFINPYDPNLAWGVGDINMLSWENLVLGLGVANIVVSRVMGKTCHECTKLLVGD